VTCVHCKPSKYRAVTEQLPNVIENARENLLAPENGVTVLEVSSNFGNQPNDGRWGILNAFDGNSATEWSSNGDDAYFIVELSGRHHIHTIEYWTRAMSAGKHNRMN
jgi:hypothetical protein